ncbi:MAG: hypothetical protein Tsb002_31600 [Wenzhouxiangellaceae bacterium]
MIRTRTDLLTPFILLPVLACATACTRSSNLKPDQASVEQAVRARFDSLVEAAMDLDAERYFSHFNRAKFTALNENGTVTPGFEGFKHDYLTGTASVRRYLSLSFNNINITVLSPATAVLINEYQATVELVDGGTASFAGAGAQIWRREDADWQLVHVSSSSVPETRAPQGK